MTLLPHKNEDTSTEIIRVKDASRTLEFKGELLGEISTETPDEPRWLEIELYRVTDGTNRYVLHLVGRSVVYHQYKGSCNRGVPASISEFPRDAEPCDKCHPPEWADLPDDVKFDLEIDRHTTHVCDSPTDVVDHLKVPNRNGRNKTSVGTLSGPAQRLLDIIAPIDPDIAAVTSTVERL